VIVASEVETVNYAAPHSGGYVDDTPPSWREALGTRGIFKLALVVGLVIWLYWEQLVRFVLYWQQPDWSHGFLIPLFCIYLVHNRRRELLEGPHHGSVVGLIAVVGSIAVYFASIYLAIGYFQALSILGVIGGLVLAIRGWKSFYVTAFPIAFIFLAIPPPTRLYREFTQPMTTLTTANPALGGNAQIEGYSPAGPPSAGGLTPGDILSIIRQRLLSIIFLGGFLAAIGIGAVIFWYVKYPGFSAEAYIEVTSPTPADPNNSLFDEKGLTDKEIERAMQSQMLRLQSPGVLSQVVRLPEIRNTYWLTWARNEAQRTNQSETDILKDMNLNLPVLASLVPSTSRS